MISRCQRVVFLLLFTIPLSASEDQVMTQDDGSRPQMIIANILAHRNQIEKNLDCLIRFRNGCLVGTTLYAHAQALCFDQPETVSAVCLQCTYPILGYFAAAFIQGIISYFRRGPRVEAIKYLKGLTLTEQNNLMYSDAFNENERNWLQSCQRAANLQNKAHQN